MDGRMFVFHMINSLAECHSEVVHVHTASWLDTRIPFARDGEWLGSWDTLIEDLTLESVPAAPDKGELVSRQRPIAATNTAAVAFRVSWPILSKYHYASVCSTNQIAK